MTLRLTSHVAESQPVKVFLSQWDGSLGSKFSERYFIFTFLFRNEVQPDITASMAYRLSMITAEKKKNYNGV